MASIELQHQVAELYAAFFNRAPDAAGFAYWLKQLDLGNITLKQMAADWSTSQAETAAKYPANMAVSDFVDAIYNNVLGRVPDAAGKTYWTNSLATGAVTREGFIQEFIRGAQTSDAQFLSNQAEVGQYFAQGGNQNLAQAINIMKLVTSDAGSVATAKALIDGTTIHSGTVMDGYISGATVFLDTNFNSQLDAGEASTTTNSLGGFSLKGGIGQLVATGGTDITTGTANKIALTAMIGSTLVSPVTTLIAQTAANDGLSNAAAESIIQNALGIVGNIDLLNENPFSIIASATSTDAQKAAALKVQAANIQLNNILTSAVSALQGAGETMNAAKVASVVAHGVAALAQQITAAAAAGTTVDLASASVIKSVLTAAAGAASSAGAASLLANATGITTVLAENNAEITAQVKAATPDTVVTALVQIAKIQEMIQDSFGDALATGVSNISTIVTSYTGALADIRIGGAVIGIIDDRLPMPIPEPEPEPEPDPVYAVTYSGAALAEAAANDGSITAKLTLTLTGGKTFNGTDGQPLAGAVVTNTPAGLTAVVTKLSATTAELSFTGNATSHADANDINNLTVTLGDSAFTGGAAAGVTGATKSNLVVDFASNAAPSISGVPGTATAVDKGVATALADFTVADTNAGDTLSVTLTATNGTINGLTDADGVAAGIQLTGTAVAINAALAAATFTATADGSASIGVSVSDGHVASPTTATYSFTASTAPHVTAMSLSGKTLSIAAEAGSTLVIFQVYREGSSAYYDNVTAKFVVTEVTPGNFTAVAKPDAFAGDYPVALSAQAGDGDGNLGTVFADEVSGTIDSTPPKVTTGTFINISNATISVTFDSAVGITNLTGVSVQLNGAGDTIATGVTGSATTIGFTSTTTLTDTDFVKLVYDNIIGNIVDAAGNPLASMTHYIGGTGINIISAAGDPAGTRIDGNAGADIITGGAGADRINLGVDAAADVVNIAMADAVRAVIDLTQSQIGSNPPSLNYLDTFKGGFDVITNMKFGDTLDFQGLTLTEETRDGSASVGTYQAIKGRYAGTTFTADDSANADILILWNDGTNNDNAVVLIGIETITGLVIG